MKWQQLLKWTFTLTKHDLVLIKDYIPGGPEFKHQPLISREEKVYVSLQGKLEFEPKVNFHVSAVSDPTLKLDLIISFFKSHCHLLPPAKLNWLHPFKQWEVMLSQGVASRHLWITSRILQVVPTKQALRSRVGIQERQETSFGWQQAIKLSLQIWCNQSI